MRNIKRRLTDLNCWCRIKNYNQAMRQLFINRYLQKAFVGDHRRGRKHSYLHDRIH
jgi:hypothetical protein